MDGRDVIIFSGLPYSGKSTLLGQVHSLSQYREAATFSQDKSGKFLYGDRVDADITETEHIFKNEWMRYEILRSLVLGTKIVLVDSVMLTRHNHQRPMLEMLAQAEQHIQAIDMERGGVMGEASPSVRLKVLLCFATPEVLEARRLSRVSQDERRKSHGPIFDLQGMWGAYKYFEFPDASTYEPLYVDTSDDSPEEQLKRITAIEKFMREGVMDKALNESNKQKAVNSYQSMYAKVKAAARAK